MTDEKKCRERLTKRELTRLWNRYMWFYNGCTNFENFYGNGWAWCLRPLFKKYYDKEGVSESMKNHLDWYNNEAQTGAILAGIVVGMEEERAVMGNVDPQIIRTTKATMQGPIAGIGDSIVQGTLIPLLLGIAINMAETAGIVGPIFYIVSYLAMIVAGTYILFNKGYVMGRSALTVMTGSRLNQFIEAFMLFGSIVVGALGANYVKASTALQWGIGESVTTLQSVIDGIFPKLLSLGVIMLCYWLVRKKNIGMVRLIVGLLVVVVAGTYAGIF